MCSYSLLFLLAPGRLLCILLKCKQKTDEKKKPGFCSFYQTVILLDMRKRQQHKEIQEGGDGGSGNRADCLSEREDRYGAAVQIKR
jgi:hypothetical protein